MAIGPRAVSYLELLIPKLYFEAKTPVRTHYSTDDTLTFGKYIFEKCAWGPVERIDDSVFQAHTKKACTPFRAPRDLYRNVQYVRV